MPCVSSDADVSLWRTRTPVAGDMIAAILGGLALGSVYALIALGFHITASVSGAMNFAQGSCAMLGAVATLMLVQAGLPMVAAIPVALILCGGYGLVVERIAVRPFLARRSDAWLMATVAFGLVTDNVAMMIFGAEPRSLGSSLAEGTVRLAGHDLGVHPLHLLIPPVAIGLAALLDLVRRRTLGGIAMLAVAQNRDAASLVGIPAGAVIGIAFVIASMLAGVGGIMIAPLLNVQTDMGMILGLKAFAVAILGGLGSAWGVVIAGLLFGVGEALVTLGLGSGFTLIISFAMVIAALAVRPDGLLGRAAVRKI
jgi:branched-chain amino acid transport system permease protein